MALFKVKAVPDFTQLRNELTKLSSTPVKIKVDATEFQALSNQAIKTMNATARLTKAQNELAVAQEKTKQTTNQLAAAQQKTTQTANQLATQMERTATAEEKARKANLDLSREIQKATTEQEKQKTVAAQTALQQEKTATSAANLAVQQEKTATAAAKAAGNITKVGQSAKETSGFAGMMGDSFANVVGKMAAWQLLGSAISGAVNAFRDALDTMKSVDDEMVTIRKVTGATTEELQKIEAQAYKTASAYGVAADEYLNSVAAFTRAGYGDQASALAELATKTQIVGDTDAQTAQQFLLSVDAAYKYRGSIESLSRVLDGANEIDNKYATSIEKIAEGLGKVAPIASQAHVGVDELTAAIGTITAVTQRSGTEAATALRALFLNIIGDTKTEIDEGVTWTTGEIAGLRDVIKLYAKDAYEAAEATGSVINPMEAIGGLAQSMKDGLLTEQQLMEMVSDIGGKLRTSQLLALIQNWDMYKSMLGDYANSIGSADKEVENALDSWSRKTEILRNKWTEFISHLVETDGIKDLIDSVIDLVDGLDEGAQALSIFGEAISFVIKLASTLVSTLGKTIGAVSKWARSVGGDYKVFTEDIAEASEKIKDNKARLDEINNTPWNERTTAILAEKEALEKENAELEANIQLMEKKNYQSANTQAGAEVEVTRGTSVKSGLLGMEWSSMEDAVDAINRIYGEGTLASRIYISNLTEVNDTIKSSGDALNNYLANTIEKYTEMVRQGKSLTDQQIIEFEGAKEAAEQQAGAYEVLAANGDTLTESQLRVIEALQGMAEASGAAAQEQDILVQAMADLINTGYLTEEMYQALIAVYPQLADAATQTADGYVIQKEALENLMSAEQRQQAEAQATVREMLAEAEQAGYTGQALYDYAASLVAASNTALNVSQQMSALQALAVQAGYTAQAIAQVMGFSDTAATNQIRAAANGLMRSGQAKTSEEAMAMAKANYMNGLWGSLTTNYTPNTPSASYPSRGGYSGGGSSSGGGSGRRGSSSSSGGSSSSSSAARKEAQAEIKRLQKERDAELDVIQKQIDALQEQAEIEDRQAKIEEYKLDILKKQDAVMNARNERTVRQYNASTGQWEWVADATKVKKAEEDLENAKKQLREYERKVELDLAVDELKTRQEAIKAAYQIKIDAWQDYLDGLSSAIASEKALLDQSVLNNWDAASQINQAMESIIANKKAAANTPTDNNTGSGNDNPGGGNSTGQTSPNGWIQRRMKDGDTLGEAQRSWSYLYVAPGGTKPSTSNNMGIGTGTIMYMQQWYGTTADGKWGGNSYTAAGGRDAERAKQLWLNFGDYYSSYSAFKADTGYYDAGGILKGMGGIKATSQDEIVLPPKLAAKMLTPLADRTFKARLGELGFLYGAENNLPRTLTGSSDNRSYTDNSGTRYQIGSIVMTEQQAKNTTIYEAAQQAHNLQAFSA